MKCNSMIRTEVIPFLFMSWYLVLPGKVQNFLSKPEPVESLFETIYVSTLKNEMLKINLIQMLLIGRPYSKWVVGHP